VARLFQAAEATRAGKPTPQCRLESPRHNWRFEMTTTDTEKKLRAQIAALREITRAISAAYSLEQILALITRKTAHVMHADSCSIYLLDDGEKFLVLKATTGLATEAVGHARLKIGEGLTGHAAKTGKPVAASQASRDPHFKYLPETKERMFQSLLAVPLIARGKIIGALNIQTREGRAYPPDEIELLSIIADVAAGELEKAMLYEEIGGLKEALETRKLVERAKGFLMKRYAITEPEAFARIQLQARNARKSMREIAEAIILVEEV
jgi:uroporphyrinogen-III synthase